MITEKDVQEISDYLYNHGNLPRGMQPKIISGLKECLSLRKENNNLKRVEGIWILREKELCEQKKVLIEDANNLANELFGWLGNAQFRKPMSGDSAMKNHAALIKKLEK